MTSPSNPPLAPSKDHMQQQQQQQQRQQQQQHHGWRHNGLYQGRISKFGVIGIFGIINPISLWERTLC